MQLSKRTFLSISSVCYWKAAKRITFIDSSSKSFISHSSGYSVKRFTFLIVKDTCFYEIASFPGREIFLEDPFQPRYF